MSVMRLSVTKQIQQEHGRGLGAIIRKLHILLDVTDV